MALKNQELVPHVQKREELSLEDDVVLWGPRVIIPDNDEMRQMIIDELHNTNPGIVKMKTLGENLPNLSLALTLPTSCPDLPMAIPREAME